MRFESLIEYFFVGLPRWDLQRRAPSTPATRTSRRLLVSACDLNRNLNRFESHVQTTQKPLAKSRQNPFHLSRNQLDNYAIVV